MFYSLQLIFTVHAIFTNIVHGSLKVIITAFDFSFQLLFGIHIDILVGMSK